MDPRLLEDARTDTAVALDVMRTCRRKGDPHTFCLLLEHHAEQRDVARTFWQARFPGVDIYVKARGNFDGGYVIQGLETWADVHVLRADFPGESCSPKRAAHFDAAPMGLRHREARRLSRSARLALLGGLWCYEHFFDVMLQELERQHSLHACITAEYAIHDAADAGDTAALERFHAKLDEDGAWPDYGDLSLEAARWWTSWFQEHGVT